MTDHAFLQRVCAILADLPDVHAVTLGGSRAQGTAHPDSDWDLGIYYRGDFDPQHLREIGWDGEVSEIGGWGGGVFNGGAWLSIEGRKVDVHYRDLDVVEDQIDRAGRGEFDIEPLMFHLAGIPTYLVVAELAIGRTLHGKLPSIETYPDLLRQSAAQRWAGMGDLTLSYAQHNHAPAGRVTASLGSSLLLRVSTRTRSSPPAENGSPTRNACSNPPDSPASTPLPPKRPITRPHSPLSSTVLVT
ncbi:nucleotidyltransferase domain-containing protein [Nesterenkonia ebinurensis]|uniref:nucleotidyltransferase domain-containing protein n=1 Tax=Nesterenkonia ebinurensis TaxID=2608252 RepID=UPI001CC76208|nr:nucleotidyltransferase domain-containing protein [Nesterenkonia ebinurensis]